MADTAPAPAANGGLGAKSTSGSGQSRSVGEPANMRPRRTGRFGIETRSYQDRRFDDRRDSRATIRDHRVGSAIGCLG
jgi:hypothetical protein